MTSIWTIRCAAAVAAALLASHATASAQVVTGTARAEDGQPVPAASVVSAPAGRGAVSDSLGRYAVVALPPGTHRLVARRIGFDPRDTTITLAAGDTVHWNPVLPEASWVRQAAEGKRQRAAVGRIDSIAAGLVRTDSSGVLTYEGFGIELLRAAITNPDSTRVLSPLSAGQALTILWGAATDSTARLIQQGLRIGSVDLQEAARRGRRFNTAFNRRTDAELRVANVLWVDERQRLQPAFATWARDGFSADARSVPLQSEKVVPILNAWASKMTNERIRGVVREPFADDVVTVLMNAVYMKSVWLEPFEPSATKRRAFTTAAGARISVPTMERAGAMAVRRGPGYRALRLPYRAGLTAMYVVLPDSGTSAMTVLDTIARSGWPVPHARADARDLHLRLPRFHAEQKSDLHGPLSKMGLGIIFDRSAQLPNLLVDHDRLAISRAMQSVYLDVDEKGTEAAAITTFDVQVVGAGPPPASFFIDRPFLFALRDEVTGTLLFIGYVADPRK